MGSFLHKLGESAFTHRWRVITIWLVLMVGLGGLAALNYQPLSNTLSIPGTSAQTTLERYSELFPDTGQGSAQIVFATKPGDSIDKHQKAIDSLSNKLAATTGVSQVISPLDNPMAVSKDRQIAYSQLQLEQGMGEVSDETIDGIASAVNGSRSQNLQIEISGDAIDQVPGDIIGAGELVGLALALGILIITLGALVAAGLPIVIAVVTVGIGGASLFGLSQVIDVTATTPVLAVMLGLAVGIDYSLFIISKYKHLLLAGHSYKNAAAKAVATAGNAVLFAAATVVIALSSLVVVGIPFMATMGLAAAATVAIAAINAVTLLPALLGFAGNRIFRSKTKRSITHAQESGPQDDQKINRKTFWYKTGERITKHPIITLVIAVVIVVGLGLPARSLELGLPTDEFAASSSTEHKAYDLLAKGFGEGFNGPLLAVAENLPTVSDQDRQKVRSQVEAAYQQEIAKQTDEQEAAFKKRAAGVSSPEEYAQLQQEIAETQAAGQRQMQAAQAKLEQQIAQYSELYQLNKVAESLSDVDGVTQAVPAMVTGSGHEGLIQVVPSSSPSSQATHDLVERLRSQKVQQALGSDLKLGVTGSAALQMDVNDKLTKALPIYLSVVVGLSLILLIIAFRSILVPIKATLGFLLSVFAMFGALVAVFQWGWFGIAEAPGPIVSFIPIISIGVLFGLAMDYEFFLVSSIHEEHQRTGNAKQAIVNGFGIGSKVVAAAAAIMVAIFASFITNGDSTIQAIGFGLAVGILVDAFIVRMVIVPAVMTLLGQAAWWLPRWLDKILPHVSIEGEDQD